VGDAGDGAVQEVALARLVEVARAPMVKMSRTMPPTPVAAPWNGSTALGWLWLSTFMATAQPSPTSTMPAFSPGPCRTRGPEVGNRPSTGRECL